MATLFTLRGIGAFGFNRIPSSVACICCVDWIPCLKVDAVRLVCLRHYVQARQTAGEDEELPFGA